MRKFTLIFTLLLAVASSVGANAASLGSSELSSALTMSGADALSIEDIQAPVFSAKSGIYTEPVRLTLSSETASLEGVTTKRYYYTTDGTDPTKYSSQAYSGVVPDIKTSCTVKAILYIVYNGEEYTSAVSSETYIVSEILPYKKIANKPVAGTYVFESNASVATPLAADANSLVTSPVAIKGNYIETVAYYALTVTEAQAGSYYITDGNKNYLYITATGELATAKTAAEAAQWQCVELGGGTYVFANSANYGLFYVPASGCFEAVSIAAAGSAVAPTYYAQGEYPTMTISPSGKDEVDEIGDIIVSCSAGISFDEEAGIVTLIDPSSGVWDDNAGNYIYSSYYEYYAENISDTEVRLYLDATVTEPGEYQLTIPADFFILDPNGLAVKNEAQGLFYTIAAPQAAFEITAVTPSEGLVTSLGRIELVFSSDCGESFRALEVVDANGNKVATATPTYQDENGAWYSHFNIMAYVLDTEITTPGVYTLEIPANAIPSTMYDSSWMPIYMEPVTLKWAIGEENMTGIDGIQVEKADAVAYDITGRIVKDITAPGIYIVNGKKVLVK